MIAALLVLSGLLLLLVPGAIGVPIGGSAREWARLAAASLLLGFATLEIGLILLALPTILLALHAAGLAAICEHVLTPLSPGGDAVGWTAAFLASAIAARAWYAGRRGHQKACAAEAEPWLGRHENRGDFELVVLPTPRVLAMSVPVAQPQVLISDGLVERLDRDQLEAVIRHEATHHRFRHWRYSLIAASIERSLRPIPGVARSTRALRTALEVWADEGAAGNSAAGRAVVRRAITALSGPPEDSRRRRASRAGVTERSRRLDRSPRRSTVGLRLATHAPLLILGLFALALVTGWMVGAHHAAALGGYCPD
jgi:hypothetical protein